MKEAVVFLASGGLDSTVGIVKAIEEYKVQIYPLYVRRGSKAERRELEALEEVRKFLGERYPDSLMNLIITDVVFPPQEWKHLYDKADVERRGHPMRDIMLQAIGVQCAEYLNVTGRGPINTVMVGQTADEVISHATVDALRLASFYTQLDRTDESWAIRSPFLWRESMTKADVVRWGIEHDIPLNITWSCFEGGAYPCGKCQECLRREKALAEVISQ